MKFLSHAALVLTAILVTACGGGGTTNEMQDVMVEMTAVLKDVKDVKSAEAAKPKLEPLMAKYSGLLKEAAKNPKETAVGNAEDAKKYADAAMEFGKETSRIMSNPELGKELTAVLTPKVD